MTERGQLATEAQRNDMDLLVGRLEELKADQQLEPFKDENMVSSYYFSRTASMITETYYVVHAMSHRLFIGLFASLIKIWCEGGGLSTTKQL